MITMSHTMLIELAILFMFTLLLSSFIAFFAGEKLGKILKEVDSIKMQADNEKELEELLKLNDLEWEIKTEPLHQALLVAKLDTKYMAIDWLDDVPNHPRPLWHLATAYDRLNDDINLKHTLIRLQKELPNWNLCAVDEWLQAVNARLNTKAIH